MSAITLWNKNKSFNCYITFDIDKINYIYGKVLNKLKIQQNYLKIIRLFYVKLLCIREK